MAHLIHPHFYPQETAIVQDLRNLAYFYRRISLKDGNISQTSIDLPKIILPEIIIIVHRMFLCNKIYNLFSEKSLNLDQIPCRISKANGVYIMSKIANGLVLFSLLLALSLGVAYAESEVAATENVTENETAVNETANATLNETLNATGNETAVEAIAVNETK